MSYFLQFSKARYTFEKKYLKKFSSKRNWEQMRKLDSVCKSLSANQVNLSV